MKLSKDIAAVVTGGASGLGLATTKALIKKGVKVCIFDVNEKEAKQVSKELKIPYAICDVTQEEAVIKAFKKARKANGQERILVNCAGIGMAIKTTSKGRHHDLNLFNIVIQINLVGTFRCITHSATGMANLEPLKEGERGAIINTASVAAFDGQIGQAAYSASKNGVVGMTLPIARDLSKLGIRVNTIAPGIFDTPLLALAPQEMKDALGAQIPFPARLGQSTEYASLALELCQNSYMNGETIRLDGAVRMAPK